MSNQHSRRLKKNKGGGKTFSPFKYSITKNKFQRHKNLKDLINERKQQYGEKFISTTLDSDEDYGFAEARQPKKPKKSYNSCAKSKGRGKSKKVVTVDDYLNGADSNSDVEECVNSKRLIESNIWIKRRNTYQVSQTKGRRRK